MPSYQQLRFMPRHTEFYHNEPIYGQVKPQKKKEKSKQDHYAYFEDLKARNARERREYERMMHAREMGRHGEFNPYKYDSLKLVGSCNDVSYLDNFMSMPRQRSAPDIGFLNRSKGLTKSSSTIFGKGQKERRNSSQSESVINAAMLASLKNTLSDDNIYESVEMIHYKKTLQNLNFIEKTAKVQKTGHPLFDSLREEQALKAPSKKSQNARKENAYRNADYSDGISPTHSSSSSGDEYEMYPRMRQMSKSQMEQLKKQSKQKSKRPEPTSSESDEEWRMIPRPKFYLGKAPPQRRVTVSNNGPSFTDDSDSSINSTILR